MGILRRSMQLNAKTGALKRRVFPRTVYVPNNYRLQRDIVKCHELTSFLVIDGYCPLKIGEIVVLYCAESAFIVEVVISEVYCRKLGDIPLKYMMRLGHNSYAAMVEAMQKDRPYIELDSTVTVIEWDDIHGALAERPDLVETIHEELGKKSRW